MRSTSGRAPCVTCPVTTKSGVKDDLLVLEVVVDVAASLEHCNWFTPVGRRWVARADVRWNG